MLLSYPPVLRQADQKEEFARKNGYRIEPTQQLIQERTYASKYSTGRHDVTFENGTQDIVNEKYGIIPHNMRMEGKRNLMQTFFEY